jgi:hypothetical protein
MIPRGPSGPISVTNLEEQIMTLTATSSFSSSSPATALAVSSGAAGRWTGRTLSGLAVLFLAFDAAVKLTTVPEAVKATAELGYSLAVMPVLAALELLCLVLYLVPRTALVGAVLWTGYLGGAIATHLRVGNPLFSHTLFPIYVAALLWGGLWLRDRRVSALLAPAAAR